MEDSPLVEKILQAVQEYERFNQQRLEAAENRVDALEEENQKLRAELDQFTSPWGEISDEVLQDRLRRLGSPPLDTLIREAGVVLEDRLRQVAGDAHGALTGVGLVDNVFRPEGGRLEVSHNPGEQDGVRMLFRGAMQFVRNPPMHKLIEYPESTAELLIRLIDSLLQLLSELEPLQKGQVTVHDVRRVLTRRFIPEGQLDLYKALYAAGDQGLTSSELAAGMNRSRSQVAGVLGALGNRITHTKGLEGKGGILVVLSISEVSRGEWHYRMKSILREALEAEGIV